MTPHDQRQHASRRRHADTDVRALALGVVGRALTARLWCDLGRPRDARREVDRALTALADFDAALAVVVARLPPEPPTTPAAGPVR
jgi:hypothetical protein